MIPTQLRFVGLCSWCRAPYQPIGMTCLDCGYPYHNVQFLRAFDDIKAFHFHPPVGLTWFQDYQNKLGELSPCAFCGGQAFFSIRGEFIPEETNYFICEISCIGGCTNSTPWLFLYDFSQFYPLLLNAWAKPVSRLPLVFHSDLKQPSFVSFLPPIKRKSRYSKGLYKTPKAPAFSGVLS